MKDLNRTFAILTLFSLTSCLVPEKVVEISEKVGVKGSFNYNNSNSQPKKDFDPVNSKYTQRDFAGCFTAIALAPVVKVTESILNVITLKTEVDIFIKAETIKLVKSDLDQFLKNNGKMSPDDFWNSLSLESYDSLILDLIPSYNSISTEQFEEKKKVLAYAFLYYLEVGEENGSYLFTFDDRESEDPRVIREYISFGGSRKIKDAKDVGICGYFRFSNINTHNGLVDSHDFKSKVLCENDFGSKVELVESTDDTLILKYKFKSKPVQTIRMNSNDLSVDSSTKNLEIEYSRGWSHYPKVFIDIKKRFQTYEDQTKGHYVDNSVKGMNLQVKYHLLKGGDKFKNLRCREVKAYTFDN